MRRRVELIVLLILIVVFIVTVFSFSSSKGVGEPPYTVYCSNKLGASLFFDTLKKLNYPVKISNIPLDECDTTSLQIVIEPNLNYASSEDFSDFTDYEGNIILFTDNVFLSTSSNLTVYDLRILNEALYNDRQIGYEVIKKIDSLSCTEIYFNEYYHGYGITHTLWSDSPIWLKLTIVQFAICAVLIVWVLGRRFGNAVPYYEEIEREENEYVYTVAELYKKTGHNKAVFESYYNDFINKAVKLYKINIDDNVLKFWNEKGLRGLEILESVQRSLDLNSLSKKDMNALISKINELNKILGEESDLRWR